MKEKENLVLKFSSYKEKIYEELKNSIINNVFEPNSMLNEREIAENLGVSRTPVREALKLLEFEGWVITIPWKGTFVSDLGKRDVKEVIQLRKALECLAMELIENVLDEDLENLRSSYQKMIRYAKENKPGKYMNEDKDFHLNLVRLSSNSRLIQILSNLSDHIYRIGIRANKLEGRIFEAIDEHMLILNSLANGDTEEAKNFVIKHLENTEKAISSILDKEEQARKEV